MSAGNFFTTGDGVIVSSPAPRQDAVDTLMNTEAAAAKNIAMGGHLDLEAGGSAAGSRKGTVGAGIICVPVLIY